MEKDELEGLNPDDLETYGVWGSNEDDLPRVNDLTSESENAFELITPHSSAEQTSELGITKTPTLDSTILLEVKEQIALLQQELQELRGEFTQLRSNTTSEIMKDDLSGQGFFEEDADIDESIALSKSELENIFKTTDITKKVQEEVSAPEGLMQEEVSAPEGLMQEEVSAPEGLMQEEVSVPEGLMHEEVSVPEGLMHEEEDSEDLLTEPLQEKKEGFFEHSEEPIILENLDSLITEPTENEIEENIPSSREEEVTNDIDMSDFQSFGSQAVEDALKQPLTEQQFPPLELSPLEKLTDSVAENLDSLPADDQEESLPLESQDLDEEEFLRSADEALSFENIQIKTPTESITEEEVEITPYQISEEKNIPTPESLDISEEEFSELSSISAATPLDPTAQTSISQNTRKDLQQLLGLIKILMEEVPERKRKKFITQDQVTVLHRISELL